MYLLIYTIVFILAHASFMFFFFRMIQQGGMLDVIFNYQKMLDYLYGHKYTALNLLGKALGNCELCTCFWFSAASFFTYRWLAIELGMGIVHGYVTIIWFWVYMSLAAMYSYWFVGKMQSNGL